MSLGCFSLNSANWNQLFANSKVALGAIGRAIRFGEEGFVSGGVRAGENIRAVEIWLCDRAARPTTSPFYLTHSYVNMWRM